MTAFSLVLPAAQALLCALIIALAMATGDGVTWLAAIPLVPTVLAAVALRQWFRRQKPLDPPAWLPSAFAVMGVQLLLGAIPCYGIAVNVTAGATQAAVTGLFLLCWGIAATTCVAAYRAQRTLLTPLVPELGSADIRLALGLRVATSGFDLVSARIVIDRDYAEWTVRAHRGRSSGPRLDMAVPFGELVEVKPVLLPVPELRPWATLPGGTTLYSQAGPAVIVTTVRGQWSIPVHDAYLVTELLRRRRALWAQGNR